MNGISAHIKEAPQSFWAPSTRQEHKKSEIWKEGLTWPCWHSALRLPVSRTVRNTYISIHYIFIYNIQHIKKKMKLVPTRSKTQRMLGAALP